VSQDPVVAGLSNLAGSGPRRRPCWPSWLDKSLDQWSRPSVFNAELDPEHPADVVTHRETCWQQALGEMPRLLGLESLASSLVHVRVAAARQHEGGLLGQQPSTRRVRWAPRPRLDRRMSGRCWCTRPVPAC